MSTILHNIWEQLCYDPQRPLMFTSGLFWCLFLLFLPIYALLKDRKKQMMVFVTAFSLYFFYKSSSWFFLLLVATSLIDWYLARRIDKPGSSRKPMLVLSICLSLGILFFFKYTNFMIWNINALMKSNLQPLDLILPLGISFYTFKSISYVVDVYKGKLHATESWLEYVFYLSYFPALGAGPIVRAEYFLPQLKKPRTVSGEQVWSGLWLVMLGVLKKAVFADYIAQYNNIVLGNPSGYSGVELLAFMLGYTMQIYCDFSGYSDMAIGLGRIMGFDLGVNFNLPYRSLNVTEFWRRWHISLSTWLRDYLYIPLGGNRKGKWRQQLNQMVTMLLGGLWHGAAWNFIIWGAGHGLALCLHKLTRKRIEWLFPDNYVTRFCSWLLTFVFVAVMWVYFAAPADEATAILTAMVTRFDPAYFAPFFVARKTWCILMAIIFVLHFVPVKATQAVERAFVKSAWWVKLLVFLAVVQLVIEFAAADVQPFIYNQF